MTDLYEFKQSEKPLKAKKSRTSRKKKLVLIAIGVVVVAALAGVIIWQQMKISSGETGADADARATQNQVAKLMVLPNENALVSDVSDASKITSQAFFANAKNGDKVLVFATAAKIVIYRPSENKIVNAGPIVDDTASTDSTNSNATSTPTTTTDATSTAN